MVEHTEVVVVGGGYAGVLAANRLTRRDDVAVTLVNPRTVFVERIRLHQLVGGSHDAVVDYRKVLSDQVRLVVDQVTRIDPARRRLQLATGGGIDYDYLVYAVGSGNNPSVPAVAYSVASWEQAQRLRSALTAAPAAATVTVAGGGTTGIEVAAELAETGRAVTLVCGGQLGPYLHPRGRGAVARRLATLGVKVLEDTRVTAVTPEAVHLDTGQQLPSQVTIWTAGFAVPDLAVRSGLATDALGRLLTDETLTSVDDVRIVAAGDAAAPSGLPLRMSCQTASPLGAHAADTVLARIAGEQPADINIGLFGQCIALGRRAATAQFASRADTANRFHLSGRFVATVKELACRGTIKELAREARQPGWFTWKFKDDTRRQQLRATHTPTTG